MKNIKYFDINFLNSISINTKEKKLLNTDTDTKKNFILKKPLNNDIEFLLALFYNYFI